MNCSLLSQKEKTLIEEIYTNKGFSVEFNDETREIILKKNGKEYVFSQKLFAENSKQKQPET